MMFGVGQIFTVAGFSMEPLLRNGDRVRLTPARRSALRIGDLVAFRREDGMPVVHRVIQVTPELVTQGDNNSQPDPPCPAETPFALVSGVERGNRFTVLPGGDAGWKMFRKNQLARRRKEQLLQFAQTVCRLSPWKIREAKLNPVDFGGRTVYYWEQRAVGTYWENGWHWLWPSAAFFIKRPHRPYHTVFFRLIGAFVAGQAAEFFRSLSPTEQETGCETARRLGLSPLLYHGISGELSPFRKSQFQTDYYAQVAWEMRYAATLEELKKKLTGLQMPFCCLKGAFFAYQVYPSPAVRFRRDLDILVRREDAERIWSGLISDGWIPVEDDLRRGRPLFYRQHLPTLCRMGTPGVELHWHIFKDVTLDPAPIWQYARPTGCGTEYDLVPELHYLLSAYNMYYDHWEFAIRSLLDMALLQKKFRLTRTLIENLNHALKLDIDLGLPYAVFPEIFPEEMRIFNSKPDPAVTAAIRKLSVQEQSGQVRMWLPDAADTLPFPTAGKSYFGYFFHRSEQKRDRQLYRTCRFLEKKLPRLKELRQEARKSHQIS